MIQRLWKWFACDVMCWHTRPRATDITALAGMSYTARCRRCRYEGLVDSQGNIF